MSSIHQSTAQPAGVVACRAPVLSRKHRMDLHLQLASLRCVDKPAFRAKQLSSTIFAPEGRRPTPCRRPARRRTDLARRKYLCPPGAFPAVRWTSRSVAATASLACRFDPFWPARRRRIPTAALSVACSPSTSSPVLTAPASGAVFTAQGTAKLKFCCCLWHLHADVP